MMRIRRVKNVSFATGPSFSRWLRRNRRKRLHGRHVRSRGLIRAARPLAIKGLQHSLLLRRATDAWSLGRERSRLLVLAGHKRSAHVVTMARRREELQRKRKAHE